MFYCAGQYVLPSGSTANPFRSFQVFTFFLPPLPHLDLPSPHFCQRPIKEIISHPPANSTTHLVINNMIIA